jgi:hypothetical protein
VRRAGGELHAWIGPDIGHVRLLPGIYRIPAAAAPLLRAALIDHEVRG